MKYIYLLENPINIIRVINQTKDTMHYCRTYDVCSVLCCSYVAVRTFSPVLRCMEERWALI